MVLLFLAFALASVMPMFFIFRKAGMSPLLGLIAFVPGLGFMICLSILAFSNWNLNASEGV